MDTLKTSVAQSVWAVSPGEKKTNAIVIAPIKNNSMFKTTEWFEIDFLKLKAIFQNSYWHSWNVGINTKCKKTRTVFPTTFLTGWKISLFFYPLYDGKLSAYYGRNAFVSLLLPQHVCEACGQTLPTRKNIPGSSTDWNRLYTH